MSIGARAAQCFEWKVAADVIGGGVVTVITDVGNAKEVISRGITCLLYTSDAADDLL